MLPEFYRDIDVPTLDTNLPDHRAVWVGAAGDLIVTTLDGASRTFVAVPAGTLIPIQVRQINTGSAASLLILL